MPFFKTLLFSFAAATLLSAENPNNYKSELEAFQQYKQVQKKSFQIEKNSFETYKKAQEKAFTDYQKELGIFWEKPKLSNKKEWITYTTDKKTRTDVNFEQEKITIETIADSEQEAQENIHIALAKAVTQDTKSAYESDPLQQRINQIQKPKEVVDAQPDAKPILKNIVFTTSPTKEDVSKYVLNNTTNILSKDSSKQKGKKIYFVDVQLPKNTTYKRSQDYYQEVLKNSQKQDISLHLIFAIIHSESSYNPMARSHIPAYGLMQIVPKTAGIDAYQYLYNKKRLLSSSYLYNSENNIEIGSAYLHILYYKYLRAIKNPQSKLYCTVAAYNTGAGNVARAFVGTNDVNAAARIINELTPDEVYRRLLRDLKYNEPKVYLQRVTERKKVYEKIYQQS
ncbi:murein transglycosylase domain-containing protein [Sulfurimonas sp. C5]|uniref:murein transglycosylase domain-containing protein n=1 Tax=Sulfurimonas sp. C5 TaxID=3036947 RepID=UPI002456AE2C|nr:murein transglycosylase domain-containing protein [Sulfurimonas sp. C5]MDH4943701.1 transglycosylase SLT domain-containing protein [Sulfurimonas sp. C5]